MNKEYIFFKYSKIIMTFIFIAVLFYLVIGESVLQNSLGKFRSYIMLPFRTSVQSLGINYCLMYLYVYRPAAFNFSNNKALAFVGLISYILYIWQQLFLAPKDNSLYFTYPLNLILTFGCGIISYYTIERAGLYFKNRL